METETQTYYVCGGCGFKHPRKDDCFLCEERHKEEKVLESIENADEFEIKPVHLALLKEMTIGWDDCEFGAPCVDPKRPYGNSDVEDDIADILKLKKKDNWDFDDENWNDAAMKKINRVHKEMQIVLEIVLHCQTFDLGIYKKKGYGEWEKKK